MQRIDQIMTRNPVVAHVDHSLGEAAQRMKEADAGALFVVDGDELVGVVTDRDLVVRGLAGDATPDTPVIDVMTRHVICCVASCAIDAAGALMTAQKIRRLAVVDEGRELVGVISLADLARADGAVAAPVLRAVSRPTGTAKTPGPEDPTGGRARRSAMGTLHVYAHGPRLARRSGSP